MSLPLDDWQFWVATAAAVAAFLRVFRGVLPWRSPTPPPTRTTLTVRGRVPQRPTDVRRGS